METQQTTTVQNSKLNIGFFFLSLGVLITLITSVVSFLNLIFATLDKRFPDVLNATYQYGYNTYDFEGIRMALATLIIFFPVFIVVSYFWKKFTQGTMGRIDEIIKKWVIYIILFLSALVIAIDLVTLVKYFVSGEVTNRFLLKVLVTLVTANLVGAYYFFLLRSKLDARPILNKVFAGVAVLFVAGAVVYSFSIMGSPAQQRLLRLDDRRINDLQSIQYQIINYWQQKEKLPEKLSDVSNPLSGYALPLDPEFEKGINYEYIVKDKMSFDLCATFALPIPKGWREYSNGGAVRPMMPVTYEKGMDTSVSYPYPGPSGMNESWSHDSGRTCFTRTIDPDIYPPYPKPNSQPVR
ncbi:MAG: DUF5671 domain-containing protein [bacterium]|nr:DUF5671 domain-containing protein [bacterium]